jgi:hypothetical protein
MVKVKVTLDPAAVERVVGGHSREAVRRAANRTNTRARDAITAAGRVGTGEMRDKMTSEESPRSTPMRPVYRVYSAVRWAGWQEWGVQGPIYPVRAKALRFKPKGSASFVFAKFVRGFPGAHFMRSAYNQLTQRDFLP